MKDFFEGFAEFCQEVLFLPLDALRELQESSWVAANALNWLFMLICFVAFLYWMKQLKGHNSANEERKDVKAHSYLGKE